jgi:hypothetical protein
MTTLKQAAKIDRRIRRHMELMTELQAQGMYREAASAEAYKRVCTEKIK